MTYSKMDLSDLRNTVLIDDITDVELSGMLRQQLRKVKTVCAKKRASKNHHRYLHIGAGFDTETTKHSSECAFVYIWQFSIDDKTYISRDINKLAKFFTILSENIKKGCKLLVYGANISYDFQFIKLHLEKVLTKVFASENRKILSYTILDNIIVQDCLGVWGVSLNKCTEHTQRKKLKGDLDYNVYRTPCTKLTRKEIMYCIHDTLICSELAVLALDMYVKNGCKIPLTMTAIVRNELKDSYTRTEKKIEVEELQTYYENQRMYNVFRQFLYSGGWTHSNNKYVGITLKNVKCFDIESSYPSQMLKNFPAGNLVESDYKTAFKHKHWIWKVELINVRAKTNHTLISKHKILTSYHKDTQKEIVQCENGIFDNGRLFACTKCVLLVNEIDYDNIKKLYSFKMKVLKAWYFTQSKKINKKIYNMVIKYYKLKTVLKRNGMSDTIEYKVAKSKLNSLYGMLCTQIYSRELQYNVSTGTFDKIEKEWDKCNKTIMNCYVGYWVSSYARQQLVDMIYRFPDLIIQYDTDSIYCIDSNNEIQNYVNSFNEEKRKFNLFRTNDSDVTNLGIWDYDGTYTQFCGYGAKRYIGIKKEKLKITWAGGISSDIKAQYRIDKKLNRIDKNTTIFEYMKNFACYDVSNKKTVKYIDTEKTIIVDNKEMIVKSCCVILQTTFKSVLSYELEQFKHKTDDLRNEYIKRDIFDEVYTNAI